MKNSGNSQWYEDLVEDGEEPPPEYYEKPELYSDLQEAFSMFLVLSEQSRPVGFGISRIPISEIMAYMDGLYIDDIEYRKLLIERIIILDDEFVAFQKKKMDKK